jgi:ABC-type multidrug transport system fused ATPase/permease subunit
MFRLRFFPNFRTQRKAFLSETAFEIDAFPATVAECLESIGESPEKGERIERNISSRTLWWRSIAKQKRLLYRGAAFALMGSLCASVSTFLGMRILDSGESFRVLAGVAALYFGMNFLAQCGNYQSARIRAWVSLGAEAYLAGLISKKILRLSPLAAARQSSGNLKVLITSDTKNVGDFLLNAVRNLVPTLVALCVITPLLIHFTGWAGVIGLGVMLLILPISLAMNRYNQVLQDRRQKDLDAMTSLVGEWVKNIRLVRYLSWENAFRDDVSKQVRVYSRSSVLQHLMSCLIFGMSSGWWMVSVAGVVLGSAYFSGSLELSAFFGSLWLLTFIAGYLTHLPNTIRLFGQANPSMKRIASFLSEPEISDSFLPPGQSTAAPPSVAECAVTPSPQSVAERTGTPSPQSAAECAVTPSRHLHLVSPKDRPRRLIFESVSFAYEAGAAAIWDLDLVIDLREKLGIVGEIGGGKTTFLRLLCGEFAPTRGMIFVEFEDGYRAPLWREDVHARLRKEIAFVPQEPFVSNDPISSNIALGSDVDDPRVIEAIYFAELEADVATFPLGIHEEIGESGVNLSGGQKQRLNLARAIYSKRPYLVLDDILSAVDGKTEAQLMHRLRDQDGGFILVTHRTRELSHVDRVIVMKQGRVIEDGTPKALSDDPGSHYSKVLSAYDVNKEERVESEGEEAP